MDYAAHIQQLVSRLPEIYQPIYGFRQYDTLASRSCNDRLEVIQNIAHQLRQELGRPLRVLDIGSAQGFFCFNLAAQGDEVFGIEREPQNVALCEGLIATHSLPVTFIHADCVTALAALTEQKFDLVIAFSVFHHLCFEQGLAATRQIIEDISKKTSVFLIETARHDEPPKWAKAQPKDPRDFIDSFAYVEKVSEHNTHLSSLARPLFFCSNTHWYAGGAMRRFESWTDSSHELVADVYEHTRRYYFTHDLMLKSFRFKGAKKQLNREEINGEISFLSNTPPIANVFPKLLNFKVEQHSGWILREKIPGIRLSAAILHQQNYDAQAILSSILQQLADLESYGLYHQDLRAWNIILSENNVVRLIDYGPISRAPHDVLYADKNIFLSFIILAYEIINKKLLENRCFRTAYFHVEQYPAAYHHWLLQIIATPANRWSFKLFLELLQNAHTSFATENVNTLALQSWFADFDAIAIEKKIKLRKIEGILLKKLHSTFNTSKSSRYGKKLLEKIAALFKPYLSSLRGA